MSFVVEDVSGCTVEALLGVVDADDPQAQPSILFIKMSDRPWFRFFLDAGFGVWAETTPVDVESDLSEDGFLVQDIGLKFGIVGTIVADASCIQLGDSAAATEICLSTAAGKMRFSHRDRHDVESGTVLVFERQTEP